MRLLLGSGGLGTPERREAWIKELDDFLQGIESFLFIPYAVHNHKFSAERIQKGGYHSGRKLVQINQASDPVKAVEEAEAIFITGGNSFRLCHDMHRKNLIEPIRDRVRKGLPYIGISAGTNMSCPSIKTTNDMPIVRPSSFDGLDLIPFQINPHYFSGPTHMKLENGEYIKYGGETRDDRLREFHEMNDQPILGLWEGSILRIEGDSKVLKGVSGARFFEKGKDPQDFEQGSDLSSYL